MKIPSAYVPTCAIASACLLAIWITTESASANPTGEQPHQALAAHGTIDGAKEMVANLYKLYDENEKFVIETTPCGAPRSPRKSILG